jgi:hypothetical protein
MTDRADLHDQILLFLQNEHRDGFLLADPVEVCTIGFFEHLAEFIDAQPCERRQVLETRIAKLNCRLVHPQRRISWGSVIQVMLGPLLHPHMKNSHSTE